jgi:hypothetical protein
VIVTALKSPLLSNVLPRVNVNVVIVLFDTQVILDPASAFTVVYVNPVEVTVTLVPALASIVPGAVSSVHTEEVNVTAPEIVHPDPTPSVAPPSTLMLAHAAVSPGSMAIPKDVFTKETVLLAFVPRNRMAKSSSAPPAAKTTRFVNCPPTLYRSRPGPVPIVPSPKRICSVPAGGPVN